MVVRRCIVGVSRVGFAVSLLCLCFVSVSAANPFIVVTYSVPFISERLPFTSQLFSNM